VFFLYCVPVAEGRQRNKRRYNTIHQPDITIMHSGSAKPMISERRSNAKNHQLIRNLSKMVHQVLLWFAPGHQPPTCFLVLACLMRIVYTLPLPAASVTSFTHLSVAWAWQSHCGTCMGSLMNFFISSGLTRHVHMSLPWQSINFNKDR